MLLFLPRFCFICVGIIINCYEFIEIFFLFVYLSCSFASFLFPFCAVLRCTILFSIILPYPILPSPSHSSPLTHPHSLYPHSHYCSPRASTPSSTLLILHSSVSAHISPNPYLLCYHLLPSLLHSSPLQPSHSSSSHPTPLYHHSPPASIGGVSQRRVANAVVHVDPLGNTQNHGIVFLENSCSR